MEAKEQVSLPQADKQRPGPYQLSLVVLMDSIQMPGNAGSHKCGKIGALLVHFCHPQNPWWKEPGSQPILPALNPFRVLAKNGSTWF